MKQPEAKSSYLNTLSSANLTEAAILELINKLTLLSSPFPTYGFCPGIPQPYRAPTGKDLASIKRKFDKDADRAIFGRQDGKVTAVTIEKDTIVVKYEGPYEKNLEASSENPLAYLRIASPRKHSFAPFSEAIWAQVIAAERDESHVTIYFRLQNDRDDRELSAENKEKFEELFKNRFLRKSVQNSFIRMAIVLALGAVAAKELLEADCSETATAITKHDGNIDIVDPKVQRKIDLCRKHFNTNFPNIP